MSVVRFLTVAAVALAFGIAQPSAFAGVKRGGGGHPGGGGGHHVDVSHDWDRGTRLDDHLQNVGTPACWERVTFPDLSGNHESVWVPQPEWRRCDREEVR